MNQTDFSISKSSPEPAYSQLATRLRRQIADGVYPPGSRIPTEQVLSRLFSLSPMTVRRAIGLLTDEGLLKATQGRGTFVQAIDWLNAGFSLKPLADLISGGGNAKLKILRLHTVKADAPLAAKLDVPPGGRLVHALRLLMRDGEPVLLQSGHVLYDPHLPLVEAELDLVSLEGLLSGASNALVKRGELGVFPKAVSDDEALLLRLPANAAAFALEYLFWDFQERPLGCGFFLAPAHFLTLRAKIGLWLRAEPSAADHAPEETG